MEQVTGREALVETDGTTFMDCDFESVQLVYRGGEHPLFESCRFGPGVRWSFLGPALKTIQLLQRIRNAERGENFVANIFQEGKFFADEEPSAAHMDQSCAERSSKPSPRY